MNIENYISPEAIEFIRSAIQEADGNEVFFIGKTNRGNAAAFIILNTPQTRFLAETWFVKIKNKNVS